MYQQPKHYKKGKGAAGMKRRGLTAVSIWLSAEELARLDCVAAAEGVTRTVVVRSCLLHSLLKATSMTEPGVVAYHVR